MLKRESCEVVPVSSEDEYFTKIDVRSSTAQGQGQAWPLLSSVTFGESLKLSRSQCLPCDRRTQLEKFLWGLNKNMVLFSRSLQSAGCAWCWEAMSQHLVNIIRCKKPW